MRSLFLKRRKKTWQSLKRFWVFQTPTEPIVYIPNYDAILIPEREMQEHPYAAAQGLASVLPFQPPRRRRPILAVLDLLQKRYSQNHAAQLPVSDVSGDKEEGTPQSGVSQTSRGPLSVTQTSETTETNKVGLEKCEEENHRKPSEEISVDKKENSTHIEENNDLSNKSTEKELTSKVPQPTRVHSLVDTLLRDHPDMNDGFSYAFKYSKAPSKLDEVEVSVQQSINKFPKIPEEPLQLFKTPVDYKKAQDRLDSILGVSINSGGPVHLNTPGAFGPLLLSQYLEKNSEEKKESVGSEAMVVEVPEGRRASSQTTTKLMLRPVAKAVAGPRGIAVASPVAKAVLRRGQKVTLDYDPDAVAIAGPGGRAHAHPEFLVDYQDSKESEH